MNVKFKSEIIFYENLIFDQTTSHLRKTNLRSPYAALFEQSKVKNKQKRKSDREEQSSSTELKNIYFDSRLCFFDPVSEKHLEL